MGRSDAPRFCPFCKECFEEVDTCPEHDLALVAFEDLPRPAREEPAVDELLPPYELRYGRLPLFVASVLGLVGFSLPMVTTVVRAPLTSTGTQVAARVAPHLWAVPMVAAVWLAILLRRRSLRQMQGARAAVPLLALLAGAALYYTVRHIRFGAAQMGERLGREVSVDLEPGLYVMAASLALGLLSGLWLGRARPARALPHGASPDPGAPIALDDDEPPPAA